MVRGLGRFTGGAPGSDQGATVAGGTSLTPGASVTAALLVGVTRRALAMCRRGGRLTRCLISATGGNVNDRRSDNYAPLNRRIVTRGVNDDTPHGTIFINHVPAKRMCDTSFETLRPRHS